MTARSRRRLVPFLGLMLVAAVVGGVVLRSPSTLKAVLSVHSAPPSIAASLPPGVSGGQPGRGTAGAPSAGGVTAACPTRRRAAAGMTRTVPILMYHQFGDPKPWSRWPGLFVRTSDFAAQLQALVAHGWTAITAATLGQAMGSGQPVPA